MGSDFKDFCRCLISGEISKDSWTYDNVMSSQPEEREQFVETLLFDRKEVGAFEGEMFRYRHKAMIAKRNLGNSGYLDYEVRKMLDGDVLRYTQFESDSERKYKEAMEGLRTRIDSRNDF